MNKETEFYIGWMNKTPQKLGKQLGKIMIVVVSMVFIIAVVISTQQKKFSTASFEFGQTTAITGIYQEFPVPSLFINTGNDLTEKASGQTIVLVGYGKMGAVGVMKDLQKINGISFVNRRITLKGTLLYSDGKTLLQVDSNDAPVVKIEKEVISTFKHRVEELGTITISGEILDPKCYFGVMKPGLGKTHLDCAVRCIEGGMPPVFYVQDQFGGTDYYLLLGRNGEKVNHEVKNLIGQPVSISAKAVRYDDWVLLYADTRSGIERISGAQLSNPTAISIACTVPSH